MIKNSFQNRRWIIAGIISVFILVYIIQLFNIQIIQTKYKEGAENNAQLRKTIYPPRGLIYDRNDRLLVYNKPAYDIVVIMREITDLDTLSFCQSLKITKEYFDDRMVEIKDIKKNLGYSSYTPQLFLMQLSSEDIANFQLNSYKYRGFYVQNRTLREYTYPNAAQIYGSIGEVSWDDINRDKFYRMGDYAGRDGIERTYEKELRGKKGVEILLRDSRGRIKGKYKDGEEDIAPIAGTNVKLTIDIDLQRAGEELLNGKIGSIVAIEPKTGEILALVSNPTYDPSILVGRSRSKAYTSLVSDPCKPLLNRATQATYSPGSTFKPIQALIALQLGGITKDTRFGCNAQSSRPIRCTHEHGSPVGLLNAIEQSCNPYFWHAFRSTVEKDGYGEKNQNFKNSYQKWMDGMHSFGLGHPFDDSDVFTQNKGNIPTQDYYNKYFGETGWRALTIRSLSIGQGEILLTPLQLANTMAIIANKGYYVTPHLNKSDTMLLKKHKTIVDSIHFPIVIEGMRRVLQYGTGRYFNINSLQMCGKTGTVQNNHGKDHSLFVGFAPKDDPEIAIAVVIENAGFGATWASPIANLMMEQFLTGEIKRKNLFNRMSTARLNPNVRTK